MKKKRNFDPQKKENTPVWLKISYALVVFFFVTLALVFHKSGVIRSHNKGMIIALLALLSITAAVSFIAFLWKKAQQKFYQALYNAEISRKVLLKHFDYLVKYANDIIVLTDGSLKILECNDKAVEEYGYTYDELKEMNFIDLVASDDKANFLQNMETLMQQTYYLRQGTHCRKDGSTFPVETSGRFIEIDGIRYYQGIIRDITERKITEEKLLRTNQELATQYHDLQIAEERLAMSYQELQAAEEELRQQNEELLIIRDELEKSESHLKLAQQIASVASWTYNFEKDKSYWSDEMFHMLGVDKSTLPSKEIIFEHVLPEDRDRYNQWINNLLTGQGNQDLEFRTTRKNGEVRTLMGKAIVQKRKNTFVNVVGTMIDITDQKRNEQELIKAKEKAEESDYLKTAFLQNMSHEIRTPMNAIVGFSQLMQDNLSNPSKLQEFTDIVIKRSNDLLGIIDEILEISKIETGTIETNLSEADLNQQLDDLKFFFSNYKKQIGKDHVDLVCYKFPFLPSTITTDHPKLKQIFINLLHNAFKFTSSGMVEFGYKRIRDNKVVFFVSDTGTGIPQDKHAAIFERFNQISRDNAVTREGLGLGLSIVKGLVDLLQGEIWLESIPGKGTTFYFDLPYEKKEVVSMEKTIPPHRKKYHWENKTILVVEDEPWNRDFFKELLRISGVKLFFAETGKEAIDISSREKNIDLILMDIRLPDMNGNDVTRTIKKMKPEIPIIAQTAYAMDADKEKSMEAGSDNFITKPIQMDNLFTVLSGYLGMN